MSTQTEYSLDFQCFLQLVDTSLIQASGDARELAERTGTPLVICAVRSRQEMGSDHHPVQERDVPVSGIAAEDCLSFNKASGDER